MKILFLFLASLTVLGQKKTEEYKFLVGNYSKKGAEGIYYCKYNPNTNTAKIVSHSPAIEDPSFLAISNNQKNVYSVSETDGGSAVALDFDIVKGDFKVKNLVKSGGAHPCHIVLDKTGKWAFTANYSGGSVGVLPIKNDGTLGEAVQSIQHYGSGPNKSRQEKPHVHSVNISPDNKQLFVVDLGIDEIKAYDFNATTGNLKEAYSIKLSSGSGPRHFTFHPTLPYAYVIQELTGKVTTFSYLSGKLEILEEVSTLPSNFTGKNACADIHISPDGKYLYGSNRFFDKIVMFQIDQKSGLLTQVNQTDVAGKTPRNFGITPDGKYLFVANQDSDNIVIFKRDVQTGLLTNMGRDINISMPVCIKFLK